MDVKAKISYEYKYQYYRNKVYDETDNELPIHFGRVYERECEASIAAGIIEFMFTKIDNPKEFDHNELDFNVRVVFRLLNVDGRW